MKNMLIPLKILVVFVPVLLALVASGAIALLQMQALKQVGEEIESNWLPSVEAAGRLNTAMGDFRNVEAEFLLAADEAGRQGAIDQLGEIEKVIADVRGSYEPLIVSPEEKRIYDAFAGDWSKYVAEDDELRTLAVQGDPAFAIARFVGDYGTLFDRASASVDQLVLLNDEGATAATVRADRLFQDGLISVIATIVIGLTFAGVLGWLLARSIAPPIASVTAALATMAKGNLAVTQLDSQRRDEVGQIAAAARTLREGLAEAEKMRAEQLKDQQRQLERARAIEATIAVFERGATAIVETVASASTELQSTANAMLGAADKTNAQSAAVASASEQTASNVQSVAAATEELTSSIHEIERQISESGKLVGEAVQRATETSAQVIALTEASRKIEEVVEIISTIADQTNLLALNATIEAARAGDAGKGFAVVATEVKALANQTSNATEAIANHIRDIQSAMQASGRSIGVISETIGRLEQASTGISTAIVQQSAATSEIARSVEHAANGASTVTTSIASVSEAAGHTGAAATQVLAAASELARNGESLKAQVQRFLQEVRAA
jgi:methyl-accepting chemotaxis protein